MKDEEHKTQCALFDWLFYAHPIEWNSTFSIPMGGKRSPVVGAKLKAEGVKAGIPDIFMAIPKKEFNGLFIELKEGKNKPTFGTPMVVTAEGKFEVFAGNKQFSVSKIVDVQPYKTVSSPATSQSTK